MKYKSIEEYVQSKISQFIGESQISIYNSLTGRDVSGNVPKNIGKMISDELLGTDEDLMLTVAHDSDEFFKIKNIPVDSELFPLERISFRTLMLSEFIEDWDNSNWKNFFKNITIVALCYEGTKAVANGYRVLKKFKIIRFNSDDLLLFKESYDMVKDAIDNKDINLLPYPNSFKNQVLEIAPKGVKEDNVYESFFDSDKTKVCFTMSKDFIFRKLNSSFETELFDEFSEKSNEYNIKKFNIFELYAYDIPKVLINSLAYMKIPPFNIYLNAVDNISDICISIEKRNKLVQAVRKMINNNDTNRNIFELMYFGYSKQYCEGLIAKGLSINTIKYSDDNYLKERFGIGKVMSSKLKDSINSIDQLIYESNKNLRTDLILENIIKENTIHDYITIFRLKQIISKDKFYNEDNFQDDYYRLLEDGKIEINSFGIKYKFLTFEQYLKNNYDDKISDILIKRYSGATLEAIGNEYNITRERIRQICKKVNLDSIDDNLVEDKYRYIFEKYNWNENDFCSCFNEKPITYNYLEKRYVKGTLDLSFIADDIDLTEDQRNNFKKLHKLSVSSDGKVLSDISDIIKKVLSEYAKDEIGIDELTEIYNSEIDKYPELELEPISSRNLEARLSRMNCTVFGFNHKIRYFDYENLSDFLKIKLANLIELGDGFYSTEYLFVNNSDLMNETDIRNEYELHNILKNKIDDDENNVYFLRMPNFLVEYHNKDDFIMDKIKEYSPILINDLVDILSEEYGHKKATMLSYLSVTFAEYIKNGFFDIEGNALDDADLEKLKKHLIRDIYSISEVKEIIQELGYADPNSILNNRNFAKIGFRLRGTYVLNNDFSNIYMYLDSLIEKEQVLRFDESLLKISAFYNALSYYSQHLKLFRIEDGIYITEGKLNELGVSKDKLLRTIDKIRETFKYRDYFSIKNVYTELDLSQFENLGLSEDFVSDIIFNLSDIKTLRINNNKLFCFTDKQLSIAEFMYDMVNKYSSISLDNLEEEIRKNYQIEIPFNKLRDYLYNTNIFYSDTLEKIYSDKNDYYEEVYNEK